MHMTKATRDGLLIVGAYIATSLLNYAFGVALSWFFTPAQFGVLGVVQSLLLLMSLTVGAGFAWTAAHDVASAGMTDETRRRIRAAWVANLIVGFLMGTGVWAAYRVGILPLGEAYATAIPLIGLTVVLLSARSVFNGVARGLYRFGGLSVNLVAEVLIKIAIGLGLVLMGGGVTGVMIAFAAGAGLTLLHSLWIIRPARIWQGNGWTDQRVVRATAPLFIGMLGTALMLNLDVLGLKLLAAPAQGDVLAGMYQAAVILARTPVFLAQALTLVVFSYAAAKGPSGEQQPIEKRPANGYPLVAVQSWLKFLLPAGLVFVLAPHAALSLFFPAQYQAASAPLRIAAIGGILLALVTLLNGVLQASADRRWPAIAAGIATLTQIGTLIWLIPHWGAVGAAVSLVVAGGVTLAVLALTHWPALTGWLFGHGAKAVGGQAVRSAIPLLILALPLLLIPDGDRITSLIKLSLSGLGYGLALLGMQTQLLRRNKWFERAKGTVV